MQAGSRERVGRRRRKQCKKCGGRAGRARAERTPNMYCMVVTLDVSKSSGWLNADARCPRSAYGQRCGPRGRLAGRWWRKRHARAEGSTIKAGIGHARGVHSEHALHVCDFGRVNEAQWLVEGRRGLPSRQRGQNIPGEVGGGRTWGSGGAQWGGLIGVRGAGVRGGWGAGRGRSALRTCSACL